jgi:hypothetical protein
MQTWVMVWLLGWVLWGHELPQGAIPGRGFPVSGFITEEECTKKVSAWTGCDDWGSPHVADPLLLSSGTDTTCRCLPEPTASVEIT